jgi:hypothetical protein
MMGLRRTSPKWRKNPAAQMKLPATIEKKLVLRIKVPALILPA